MIEQFRYERVMKKWEEETPRNDEIQRVIERSISCLLRSVKEQIWNCSAPSCVSKLDEIVISKNSPDLLESSLNPEMFCALFFVSAQGRQSAPSAGFSPANISHIYHCGSSNFVRAHRS